ncbi:hypothetical protein XENTR_v10023774 [Xenopus tropicalis]|nr:hypothetical protein XENTR_v10023774 [Xenopus tropicalis]
MRRNQQRENLVMSARDKQAHSDTIPRGDAQVRLLWLFLSVVVVLCKEWHRRRRGMNRTSVTNYIPSTSVS